MSTKELKLNWDLSFFYTSDSDVNIEKDIEKVEKKAKAFNEKWEKRTDYLTKPKILAEALKEYEDLLKNNSSMAKLDFYVSLRSSQDQDNKVIKALNNRITQLSNRVTNLMEFFTNRVSKITKQDQIKFLNTEDLKDFKHYLEKLFSISKYILSEEEEKLISISSKTSHENWVRMVSTFLAKEEKDVIGEDGKLLKLTMAGLLSSINSSNKITRDSAATGLNDIFKKHLSVAEQELNSILEYSHNINLLKKIERPDAPRHLEDDIDSEVVDALVEGVSSQNKTANRYYELKARLLGVEKLKFHERNVPVGNTDKKYSYEEAVGLVKKVFSSLDVEFLKIYEDMLNGGRFDVLPYKGKKSGAFCASTVTTSPVYVLLNFTNELNDVLTIAHEMGHAINDYKMRVQNNLNYGTPLCIAEVASTFMEDFVLEELTKGADDELKLSLIMAKLNDDISTIHRQVACYKFEQELHKTFIEKNYLSYAEIGEIFQKHMAAYMGDFVEQSEGSENWWVYWSHIRRFFYVYSYASGLIISKYMQRKYREDNKFIEKVKEFLSAGSSKSPKDIFLDLGIDISDKNFWIEGVKETEKLLNEAETLAKKLGKI